MLRAANFNLGYVLMAVVLAPGFPPARVFLTASFLPTVHAGMPNYVRKRDTKAAGCVSSCRPLLQGGALI